MTKIPFTLEAWLKDKSRKVIDNKGNELVICSFEFTSNEPYIHAYEKKNGGGRKGYKLDEVFFCPKLELTEFEKAIDAIYESCGVKQLRVKEKASELLALAREQFVKDGYVIEKKAFRDAVEKVSPEVTREVSEHIALSSFIADLGNRYPEVSFAKLTRIAVAAYDFGKAEALKDLPRWKKHEEASDKLATVWNDFVTPWLDWRGHRIAVRDLEKLPGFKED